MIILVEPTLNTMDMAAASALIATFSALFAIIGIGIYVYTAWALMTIGQKLNYKYPWLAWIPGANIAMVLELGGFHWAWVFLAIVPIANIALLVMTFISMWRIYETRNYPGYLILLPLAPLAAMPLLLIPILGVLIMMVAMLGPLANLVVLGLVAWQDRK